MADETPVAAAEPNDSSTEMDLEVNTAAATKRGRDDESPENNFDAKKPKIDGDNENEKSVEEKRLEETKSGPVSVGYKNFDTSVEIFDYFYKFLHFWPPNLNVNKYEHAMLLDLLKKGHLESDKKIGSGIHAFQVRYHPQWKSRCFFLVREDETADDFSFRKCVDHILPLPENMVAKPDVNKALGGGKGGGGRGGGRGNWRGRGRGGKPRN